MSSSDNIEMEAARYLHRLIRVSTDEPPELATKLYVILEDMKFSGQEHTMPYQVVSRSLDTLVNQHSLDIEVLKSSLPQAGDTQTLRSLDTVVNQHSPDIEVLKASVCLPQAGDTQTKDPGSGNLAGSQMDGAGDKGKTSLSENEMTKYDALIASQLGGSNTASQAFYQLSGTQSNIPFDHDTPSTLHSQSHNKNEAMDQRVAKSLGKRKVGESPPSWEQYIDTSQMFGNLPGSMIGDQTGEQRRMEMPRDSGGIENIPVGLESAAYTTTPQCGWNNIVVTANRPPPVHREPGNRRPPVPREHGYRPPPVPREPGCLPPQVHREPGNMTPPVHRDLGKSVAVESMMPSSTSPFKEEQLKQFMAQSSVNVALRNGFVPNQTDLEKALQINFPGGGNIQNFPVGLSSYAYTTPQYGWQNTVVTPNWPPVHREHGHNVAVQRLLPSPGSPFMDQQLKQLNAQWLVSASLRNGFIPKKEDLEDALQNQFPGDGSQAQAQAAASHSQLASSSDGVDDLSTSVIQLKNFNVPDNPDIMRSAPMRTMLEQLIMDHQNQKRLDDEIQALKRKKTDEAIAARIKVLQETPDLSESLKRELRKLKLVGLQRRLRREVIEDYFRPVTDELEKVKSYKKKHKHGRKDKQIAKYEQKMREERQKRFRERQKVFLGKIEVQKEKIEECSKARRERHKGFNKYVKEFHKRKERLHREKMDKIQREKIDLLKVNDVEGYLRIAQDVKSDRITQLLKETEKYLQTLGSKLKESKSLTRRFEYEADATSISTAVEDETSDEIEDESDQAKASSLSQELFLFFSFCVCAFFLLFLIVTKYVMQDYLERNEQYYLMAHRYQMNGLRWLISLYNNNLNGILADEMGLGKTVQVISLICYLMETKNDKGPFLVVVPSSVLPGWQSEIKLWAPVINTIVYRGTPEERRKLFKEEMVQQKFNVLLTTYEHLMNKNDRPKLSKIHWHYIIIDEGHRIKNASCKLNVELKQYVSSHRLLLTGTPLQNNLEELWALLNFLLPDIFNSSEDFSEWFNKPFQTNGDKFQTKGDNSAEEALLSEEESLLLINRLHQVLRPFMLRRMKHKVEDELPKKIERLIRCEASAYQKLLMKRVRDNLGSIDENVKSRAVQNSVVELRNICNHPYLSQLHSEEVNNKIPQHFLPPVIRLCGKLEMLDRLLPKLKATDHRVLFFCTMTRLLDVMEEYLEFKRYKYLRLDGKTCGGARGALIEDFNNPDSPYFIFLLSLRAGGVGINLQAADTVILFDTDWNPQIDLQAQARAHRIGQKKDVLVLRFETANTVEEQVRATAEHKLGVANQSITAGFFDNSTSAEDRKEYLESLLRGSKKEENAPVLEDDALNDLIARSEPEIEIFESMDKQRKEDEMEIWKTLVQGQGSSSVSVEPPTPSRLVTEDDLKQLYETMKSNDVPMVKKELKVGKKRKRGAVESLDSHNQYGRGKRIKEVKSYVEILSEDEFSEDEIKDVWEAEPSPSPPPQRKGKSVAVENSGGTPLHTSPALEMTPQPMKRGRGRPRKVPSHPTSLGTASQGTQPSHPTSLGTASQGTQPSHPTSLGTASQGTQPVKRGRGRPRKNEAQVTLSIPGRIQASGNASSSAVNGPDSAVPRIKLETVADAGEGSSFQNPLVIREIKEE
ncbi:unnamed protein product [Microthlaspi erraticum]|uniref:Uncharacterized protein n=1 Tax=Microthlaspi erraticum TaxID=1685480 RepID=A0A6D2KG00_9BRAS|nr:unnamed protein product [Microthlaspi erraticum]